jgi:hypothetical protein
MGTHGSVWWLWVTPRSRRRIRHHRDPSAEETVRSRSHEVTLLDVIQAVSAGAVNDEETVATVIHLISSGQVRLGAETITAMMDVWATVDAAA